MKKNVYRKMISLIITGALAFSLAGCGSNTNNAQPPENNEPAASEPAESAEQPDAPNANEEAEQIIPEVSKDVITDEGFDQFAPPEKGETIAVMTTNMGVIKIKFFEEDAPKAFENFTTHAKNGFYDGLTFHRVQDNFMIQGGDPEGTGRGGESIWNDPFEDEFTARLHNYRGALSMANSGPNTNGSQFFIVQAGPETSAPYIEFLEMLSAFEEAMYPDNRTGQIVSGAQRYTKKSVEAYKNIGGTPWLDGGFPTEQPYVTGHTVFGQVFEGMDIVDAIAKTDADGNETPDTPVIIEKIEITAY